MVKIKRMCVVRKNNQILDSYPLSILFVGSSLLAPGLWVTLPSLLSSSFTRSTIDTLRAPDPAVTWPTFDTTLGLPSKVPHSVF